MVVARQHRNDRSTWDLKSTIVGVALGIIVSLVLGLGCNDELSSWLLTADTPSVVSSSKSSFESYFSVSETCKSWPQIRPAGSVFFRNPKVKMVTTLERVQPPYKFGSTLPNAVENIAYHMTGDIAYYHMIRDHIDELRSRHPGRSIQALDIGANQGFYTYYLASLGTIDSVHSFEIDSNNFMALQHGIIFNSAEIANRVNLYPLGLSASEGRLSMSGAQYTGFLSDAGKDGAIQTASLDCLAYHTELFAPSPSTSIGFVKIDVEGFEIAVLQGAKQTLYNPNGVKVGSLFMEVGPKRWERASISLEDGIQAMFDLGNAFEAAHIVLREDRKCPKSLQNDLLLKNKVVVMERSQRIPLMPGDWKPLLEKMHGANNDCNFWFTNSVL